MYIKQTRGTSVDGTAAKVAEGIGEALGRIVNRLESLDADRDRAFEQLLVLQERLNEQVLRFGRAVGKTMTAAAQGRSEVHRPSGRPPRPASTQRSVKGESTQRTKQAKKGAPSRIKCGVCGTPGHNARGHARWEASRRK